MSVYKYYGIELNGEIIDTILIDKEEAVGGAGEMQETASNVTRERSEPVFNWTEKVSDVFKVILKECKMLEDISTYIPNEDNETLKDELNVSHVLSIYSPDDSDDDNEIMIFASDENVSNDKFLEDLKKKKRFIKNFSQFSNKKEVTNGTKLSRNTF